MAGKNEKVISIEKSCEVLSSVDRVWEVISDIGKDERYWTSLRDVRVLSNEGNRIEREANVGPRAFAQKSHQTLVLDPKKSIKLTMSGATMAGERSLVLVPLGKNNTRIDVSWSFEVKEVPAFVQGLVKGQISKATEEALKQIKNEAEGALPAPRGVLV